MIKIPATRKIEYVKAAAELVRKEVEYREALENVANLTHTQFLCATELGKALNELHDAQAALQVFHHAWGVEGYKR